MNDRVDDPEQDDYLDVDLPGLVASHLCEDEVAIFLEVGAEKLRYLIGHATAINHRGERKTLDLSEIYEHSENIGKHITTAAY